MRFCSRKADIDTPSKIKHLCMERYKNPEDFNEFTKSLKSLGVARQTYDVLSNTLFFYSNESMLYMLPVEEVDPAIDRKSMVIGNTLNINQLQKSIQDFDTNQLSVLEFHQKIAASGIVYVSVFLNQNKIYYIGQDGNHFIEFYN